MIEDECKGAVRAHPPSDARAWACLGFCLKSARPRKSPGKPRPVAKCGNCEKESSGSLILVDYIEK
jgi:hypothetical protein